MTEAAANTVLPGRRLQAAREKLGWSESDVAKKLHMSVSFVRAIEADDYERLPEATFIKGYMRNYARLLEIPADEVANLFEQLVDEEENDELVDIESPSRTASRPWWLITAVVVLAAGMLVWMMWPEQQPSSSPVPQVRQVQPDNVSMPDPGATAGEDSQGEPGPEEPVPVESTGSLPMQQEAPVESVTVDRLTVSFSGPCWVQVLDAGGETLFSGQRDAGGQLSLSGTGPFRLTFGNGAAVASVAVNGEAVTLPQSTPGNVVRVRAP